MLSLQLLNAQDAQEVVKKLQPCFDAVRASDLKAFEHSFGKALRINIADLSNCKKYHIELDKPVSNVLISLKNESSTVLAKRIDIHANRYWHAAKYGTVSLSIGVPSAYALVMGLVYGTVAFKSEKNTDLLAKRVGQLISPPLLIGAFLGLSGAAKFGYLVFNVLYKSKTLWNNAVDIQGLIERVKS